MTWRGSCAPRTWKASHRDETVSAQLLATNVFQRRDGRWWLVHHHASPTDPRLADAASEQMH